MRVLFTTTPGKGHLHAMAPLARAFVDRGHDVLWATAADGCAWLERDGFAATPAGLSEEAAMAELAERFPELKALPPRELPEHMFARLFGDVRAAPMLGDLAPAAHAFAPDLLVCDAAEFAGPIVAAELGVPSVTHGYGALLPSTRVAWIEPAIADLWTSRGLEPRPFGGSYDHGYVDIYPASLAAPVDRGHVGTTYPLRPATSAIAGDDELPAWVTSEAQGAMPLVYMTLGTVFGSAAVLTTVLDGVRDLPLRAVVTVGPRADPAALGPQPAHVHVTRYIAQDALLPHCALVVSHAGSGTFLASLANGLPHLCVPQAADQFLNADACTRAGVGITLLPDAMSADAVRGAVARLLAEPSFRDAAVRMAAELAGMPSPDDVAGALAARYG